MTALPDPADALVPDPDHPVRATGRVRTPPPPSYGSIGPDRKVVGYRMHSIGFLRKSRNRLASLLYEMLITHIPSHSVRLGFLRLAGARIGPHVSICRGTRVLDPEFLTIEGNATVGLRCLLDARGGLTIGKNVVIASDVHIIGGGHLVNQPDFLSVAEPTLIDDYVWIASRAMILPSLIGRGAVVSAQTVVHKDVGELEIVAGSPFRRIGVRSPEALQYTIKHRPLFY